MASLALSEVNEIYPVTLIKLLCCIPAVTQPTELTAVSLDDACDSTRTAAACFSSIPEAAPHSPENTQLVHCFNEVLLNCTEQIELGRSLGTETA